MATGQGGFKELFYGSIMPKIYGIGASVVILGAMFKILHLGPADIVLGVGLSTEAAIFFLSAFEPKAKEIDWTKVYPELSEDYTGSVSGGRKIGQGKKEDNTAQKLDQMLEKGKIGPELIDSLGKGMKGLADSASKMGNLANAAVATNDYAANVKKASTSLVEMNKSYSSTVTAMSEMANASKDAKEYHSQVQNVTKNLQTLNNIYELELQDVNNHLKSMNKFYGNVATAMESMAQASQETESFKKEVSTLTTNLTQLNKVYGNMLSAMKG
ncbi:MAG TPA: gliding motility protein GldL [Cytophagales bacterium]|nr:gliding motility protein GldL [Cytophagales bacterium]HAA18505.1 gliding motility protein GldL [Cytophagales bacterium]HAP58515.1 gliding motility protein GldL [Cytophagales bacterium]